MAKFKKLLLSQPGLSDLDRLKISYASELVRNESIKTALYGILFFLAGYFPEFLLWLAMSCTIRTFAGGIHMRTNVGCFCMGLVTMGLGILLLPRLPISQSVFLSALWICAAIICLLSPIASYKRPFKTKDRYRLCKKWSILFTLAWSLILTFVPAPAYLQNCGVCYLVLQSVQMIAQSVYRYFKHKKSIGGLHDVQKNAL